MPIVRVGNVTRAMEDLKKRGFWIYGLDERGVEDYDKVEFNTPTVLVLGGEGKGLHQTRPRELRCARSDSDGRHDSVSECIGRRGHRSVRVETANGVG